MIWPFDPVLTLIRVSKRDPMGILLGTTVEEDRMRF